MTYPTPQQGRGQKWTDISAGQYADNIDDLNARLAALEARPVEVGYNEIVAVSAAFTTIADVSGLSVSFTLSATRKILIVVYALPQSTIGSDRIQLTLADGAGTQVQVTGDLVIPANNVTVPVEFSWRKSLAAGSYTYKVRANRQSGSGTCVLNAAGNRPCYIQALDVS